MSYNTKNYMEQGGEVLHIGGKLEFDGIMPNTAASTADTVVKLKNDFNALLVALKNAGLMAGDEWSTPTVTKDINDTFAGHAKRQENTGHISSVAVSDGVITITLDCKVAELNDFDAQGGWGVHKWLGFGMRPWTSAITGLKYNGSLLTADDVTEAQSVGLNDAGYFVRWVAADLVLAGDNTQKSKNTFTISADGYATAQYTLRIVEG